MLTDNLRAEGDDLYAFLQEHHNRLISTKTQFKNWSTWDVLAHLHDSDLMALAAVGPKGEFDQVLSGVMGALGAGKSLIEYSRERLASVGYDELRSRWRTDFLRMCDAFDATDPDQKLPWFGPPMKVRMFTTARQMEIWAHGQALYDALGIDRVESDRIQDIVFLGVRTYKFCFSNRGQQPPDPMPYLELTSPSGAVWTYGEPSETNFIRGTAVDFARTVTQVRNMADTGLEVTGPSATTWMTIAQCFAGPPHDPPAPGTRFKVETAPAT